MKNPIFFMLPLLLFMLVTVFGSRLIATGSVSPAMVVVVIMVLMGLSMMIRPKKGASKAAPDAGLSILGDLAKDAFEYDEKLSKQYQSAVSDYLSNYPKSALNKLEKLTPLCKTDADTYAVSVATGLCKTLVGDWEAAINLYNKAVVLHPTTELAAAIGSCQQRLGQLNKAIDSYEFALDLDADNLDARSALATAHVANGDYDDALDNALLVLKLDETHASSLATCAICYGMMNNSDMEKHYTDKAVANGYKEEKITSTISALKKRNANRR